ncbi:MAG: hypothetical protein R3B13_02790 [Polyangiaceae bacterium]
MRRALLGIVAAASLSTGPVQAAGTSLDAMPLQGQSVRIDGLLREWRGRMTRLTQSLKGVPIRVEGMVGYDDTYVYVAIDARDTKLARTERAGDAEDHATLYLGFPSGGRIATHRVQLFPGEPGNVAGAVKVDGRPAVGAQLVEAPQKGGGVTFEARIPWKLFPEASRVRVGLRAALRYTDASAPGQVTSVVGSAIASSGSAMPALPLEAEQGLFAALKQKRVSANPTHFAAGNVSGDGMLENVAVYGGFLTIVGPKYRGGKQFFQGDLAALEIPRLELVDFDGDGRDEILLVRRLGTKEKYRDVLEVRKLGTNDVPNVLFSHEISIVTKDGRVENEVKIERGGKQPSLVVAQGSASGFEPDSYAEPRAGDMPATLLPWESVVSRSYAWDGSGFRMTGEKAGQAKVKPKAKPAGPPPPPPPRPPSADELQDRLYALYRKDRGVGKKAPRFDFVTNVAGDGTMERVLVHDKDIVVFGKRYRGGTSFAYITVGVADPKDILDVTARDLTGDGKAEIVVRAVLHAKASKELGGDVVDRYALFVYQATEGGVARVFAAETGRALGENRILGSVAFLPAERGIRIELRPGRAVGWTEKTYPFPPDTTAAGGLEPLLLPWSGSTARKYAFNGTQFVAP